MPGGLISATVPDNMPFADVLKHSETCTTALLKVQGCVGVLRAVLGKLMFVASRDKPGLKSAGFPTMGAFVKHLENFSGKGDTVLYDAMRIWEYVGDDLTAEEWADVGITKLKLLCSHTDPAATSKPTLLRAAVDMSIKDFKRHLEDTGHAGPGETSGASLILTGDVARITAIRRFLNHPEIQDHVGSAHPVEIILAAFGEAQSSDWPKVEFRNAETEE